MKAKEIDIEQFQSINDVYSFVEENAFRLIKSWDLTNLWVRYRDYTSIDEEKEKAQWEIEEELGIESDDLDGLWNQNLED